MTESSSVEHRWYPRPVFYVSDLSKSLQFYLDLMGFTKAWHEAEGAGTVCQVNHGECEIILCQDDKRRDKSRLFIELTREGLTALQREIAERSIPFSETWWGYNSILIKDPDGNELLFPTEM